MTKIRLRRFLACVVLAAGATSAGAMWVLRGESAPIDRLVVNLTRRVEKEPDNAQAHYVLGRIHSLAYALATKEVRVERPQGAPSRTKSNTEEEEEPGAWTDKWVPVLSEHSGVHLRRAAGEMTDERIEHFGKAVLHYRRAAELHPWDALCRLGLAWLLDDGNDLAPRLGWPDGVEVKTDLPEAEREAAAKRAEALVFGSAAEREKAYVEFRALGVRAMPWLVPLRNHETKTVRDAVGRLLTACWKDLALAAYVEAFHLAVDTDVKLDTYDIENPPVSKESGEAILRLLKDREESDATRKLRDEVAGALKQIQSIGSFITPVLFPTRPDATLADLAPPGRTALFDLDGDGVAERWPWPTADAAILVWRPDPTVRVTSGRQLFGSRTWWMFWKNGYEPLAALDDDGDGRLTGRELDGMCMWRDRNGDAVEDPGEVVTAAEYGVVAIETAPRGKSEGVPAHPRGVVLADGSTRPTFDWTPRRVIEAPATSQ